MGEKFYPKLIQVSKGAGFRPMAIKLIKISYSLTSIFAFWID